VPERLTPSGLRVTVQPVAGKFCNTTLPLEIVQIGCAMMPTVGAFGTIGAALSTIICDGEDVQPEAFDTV
jgi:hypothetical protein